MHAVVRLREIYGVDELSKKYVLLINAGGQSQRLPSASVLGKIFSPLPIGEDTEKDEGEEHKETGANWQLLELKLACYTPLLSRMKPGFMHVASDTIEVSTYFIRCFRYSCIFCCMILLIYICCI